MNYSSYTELDVWKKARILSNSIYILSKRFPKEELYGLSSQMRRSAVSVASNIAEGCGRNYPKDSIHFFFIARGSLYEIETQLYLTYDQEYISKNELSVFIEIVTDCKKLINGLINYFEKLAQQRLAKQQSPRRETNN